MVGQVLRLSYVLNMWQFVQLHIPLVNKQSWGIDNLPSEIHKGSERALFMVIACYFGKIGFRAYKCGDGKSLQGQITNCDTEP
jgi:hypothetical protein